MNFYGASIARDLDTAEAIPISWPAIMNSKRRAIVRRAAPDVIAHHPIIHAGPDSGAAFVTASASLLGRPIEDG